MSNEKREFASNKLEQEIEIHVLSTVIKLSDGSLGKVFTRGPRNDAHVFVYNCHLCAIPNLTGERCLQTHIAGKKHQTKLAAPVIDAETFRAPLVKGPKVQMKIAPGEPVPPGFENELRPVAQLQSTIDNIKDQSMIGLEYVMELITGREPSYHCVLCDKRGDPRTIIAHITSYNHRMKYLEKHFPAVIREIDEFRFKRDCRNAVVVAVSKVCDAIEDHHGRLHPAVHDCLEYNKNPMKFLQDVIKERHFDEKSGPNFVRFVDKGMLLDVATKDLKRNNPSPPRVRAPRPHIKLNHEKRDLRRSLDSISSISSSSLSRSRSRSPIKKNRSRSPPRPLTMAEKAVREQKPAYIVKNPAAHVKSVQASTSVVKANSVRPISMQKDDDISYQGTFKKNSFQPLDRQVLPTPRELANQANEIAAERYKWEKFRCMVEIAVGELEKQQKEYEKNPEKHPLYPDEWKKFWNRRYKELQNEKKDPSKHDFKPEWIEFWTRRMKELYDEDIEAKKIEIRQKLGLPEESEEKTEDLKEQYILKERKEKSLSPIPSEEDDVIIQDSPPKPRSRSRSHRRENSSRRSRSPSSYKRRDRDRRSPERYSKRDSRDRDRDRERRRSRERRSRERNLSPIGSSRHHSPPPIVFRDPYYGTIISHRRTPPSHYNETYEEWSARYYGQGHPHHRPYPPSRTETKEKEDDNQPLTVVSVLRLLSALEEHLGSLGPKVVDLLAKALALEKVKANSADDLLLNDDNCVIFETVKEKLKGQLIADVVEDHKIAAVKKAIKNIAAIVHIITEKSKKEALQKKDFPIIIEPSSSKLKSNINKDDDGIDKAEIAKKVAASLIAQGKTDITSAQLEELINTFVVMIKAQNKSNQGNLTTASYLKQFEKIETPSDSSDSLDVFKSNISAALEKELDPHKTDETDLNETGQLESLTDSDLQTLLQNFKDLSSEEQHHLIAYLKKLESTDSTRVEKLRKYVNLGVPVKSSKPVISKIFEIDDDKTESLLKNPSSNKRSYDDDIEPPGSNSVKLKLCNIIEDPDDAKKFLDSDDEDDYSYDDVVKAASKNISKEEKKSSPKPIINQEPPQTPRYEQDDEISQASARSEKSSASKTNIGLTMTLADTKNLIASLMGSLQKNNPNHSSDGAIQKIETLQNSRLPTREELAAVVSTARNNAAMSQDFDNDNNMMQHQQNDFMMHQQNPRMMMQQQNMMNQQMMHQNNFNQPHQMQQSSTNLPYYLQQQQQQMDQQQFHNNQQSDMNYPPQFNPMNQGNNFNNFNPNMFQQNIPNMKQPFFNQGMEFNIPSGDGAPPGNFNMGGGSSGMAPMMNQISYPNQQQMQMGGGGNHQQQHNRPHHQRGHQSANLKVLVKGKK